MTGVTARASIIDLSTYSLLDGYIYGFALTKMSLPFETP